jgi:hypothetical protein
MILASDGVGRSWRESKGNKIVGQYTWFSVHFVRGVVGELMISPRTRRPNATLILNRKNLTVLRPDDLARGSSGSVTVAVCLRVLSSSACSIH